MSFFWFLGTRLTFAWWVVGGAYGVILAFGLKIFDATKNYKNAFCGIQTKDLELSNPTFHQVSHDGWKIYKRTFQVDIEYAVSSRKKYLYSPKGDA